MKVFLHNLVAALARDTPAYSISPTTSDSASVALLRALARPIPPRILADVPRAGVQQYSREPELSAGARRRLLSVAAVGGAVGIALGVVIIAANAGLTTALAVASFVLSLGAFLISVRNSAQTREPSWVPSGTGNDFVEGSEAVAEQRLRDAFLPPPRLTSDVPRQRQTQPADLDRLASRLALALSRGLSPQEREAVAVFQRAGFEVEVEAAKDPSTLSGEYKAALALIIGGNAAEGIKMIERINDQARAEGMQPELRVVRTTRRRAS